MVSPIINVINNSELREVLMLHQKCKVWKTYKAITFKNNKLTKNCQEYSKVNDCQEVTESYVFSKVHILVKRLFMKYCIETNPLQNIVLWQKVTKQQLNVTDTKNTFLFRKTKVQLNVIFTKNMYPTYKLS